MLIVSVDLSRCHLLHPSSLPAIDRFAVPKSVIENNRHFTISSILVRFIFSFLS
ncbi:hypothetical protein QWZ13_14890 [Reinekea marina]|uniref:hypothetical protein n=1 Tax=Reinekea marina TaxID=1310421 RepID=UPI0025B40D58|nr:hypothetical protein [Reinekea marina]MDN3650203.1 hypothetical protein [Reinekea marina]